MGEIDVDLDDEKYGFSDLFLYEILKIIFLDSLDWNENFFQMIHMENNLFLIDF